MSTRVRAGGAVLAMIAATGVGATTAIGAAPAANATCASFFGLGNTANCSSGFGSIAIAIGSNAIARADGWFGVALSVGDLSRTETTTESAFTVASAMGTGAAAEVKGILSAAITAGNRGRSNVGFGGGSTPQFANLALNFGNHTNPVSNEISATGLGNLSVNVGGDVVVVDNTGFLNNATNLFGSAIVRTNGGALSWAFNAFGSGNSVTAGPGFLAIAGSLGQNGATLTQAPFGININGAVIPPSAAAINPAAKHRDPSVRSKSAQSTGSAKSRKAGSAHSARG